MPEANGPTSSTNGRAVWIDLGTQDAEGSKAFYGALFGWEFWTNPDPQYGGYTMARLNGKDVAGLMPAMSPEQPTAWTVYFGTDDSEALAGRITAAGGALVYPAMKVGDQGTMTLFTDSVGAFTGAWQPDAMSGFGAAGPGTFRWAELNARGIDRARTFYRDVFDWTAEEVPMGEGQPPYTRFTLDGTEVAGGMEMMPMVPAEVPSYWGVYFDVADLRATFARALELGATEMVPPMEYPGGSFAILRDPQGGVFSIMSEG